MNKFPAAKYMFRVINITSAMALAAAFGQASEPAPPGNGTGLYAYYFVNSSHSIGQIPETAALIRTDTTVNFDWGNGSPASKITSDRFSVVWNGYLEPQVTGPCTIYITGNDGRRVWLDGVKVIDAWSSVGVASATVNLVAGKRVPIRIDYYENNGSANIQLEWESSLQARQIIPSTQLYPEALPATNTGSGKGLLGAYFSSPCFGGSVNLRTDPRIYFAWPTSPIDGMPADDFSVRWQGKLVTVLNEPTSLILTTDDATRMWVDGQLVVNDWTAHGTKTYNYTLPPGAGIAHDIRIDHREYDASSVVRLEWEGQHTPRRPVPTTQLFPADKVLTPQTTHGTGISAAYFANETLSGIPVRKRDSEVNFKWGTGSPEQSIPSDHFSARWEGSLQTRFNEEYTLILTADDGVRLWLDGKLVINDWKYTSAVSRTYKFAAEAGKAYALRIEYFDRTGNASAILEWDSPSESRQIVPEECLSPNYLDLDIQAASVTSPAFIEGRHGAGVSLSAGNLPITYFGDSGFALNVPLSQTNSKSVSVAADGKVIVSGAIAWTPTVLDGVKNLVVRPGDSLLFKAIAAGKIVVSLNCGTSQDADVAGGQLLPIVFTAPGSYAVTQVNANGDQTAAVNVEVPGVITNDSIPVSAGYTRIKDIKNSTSYASNLVTWTVSDSWSSASLVTGVQGLSPEVKRLSIKSKRTRPSWLLGRINGSSGPVMSAMEIKPFVLRSDAETFIYTEKVFSDGSMLCRANLIMDPLVPGIDIKLYAYVSGVLFDDSTSLRWLTSESFVPYPSGSGKYQFRLIRAPGISTGVCHRFIAYDHAVQVSP
jgi:hypothetical protein